MLQSLKKQSKKKILLRLKIKNFFKYEFWQHLIVISFILSSAWLFDKFIEAFLFCISHIVIRISFDKQYHCGTTSLCLFTTLSIAFFGIATILPLELSILSSIPMCFLISWVGYIAQDRLDLIILNQTLKSKPELNDKDKFILKYKELGYNEIKTQIAIKFFLDKEKPKDVWLWLCEKEENPIEWDSVRQMKWRMKKDLFS